MPTIQPTTTITIDTTVFDVASMSAEVQQMIGYLDDWRQREVDTTSELLMIRGALRDIQNTILTAIQSDQAAAGEALTPDDTPPAAEA